MAHAMRKTPHQRLSPTSRASALSIASTSSALAGSASVSCAHLSTFFSAAAAISAAEVGGLRSGSSLRRWGAGSGCCACSNRVHDSQKPMLPDPADRTPEALYRLRQQAHMLLGCSPAEKALQAAAGHKQTAGGNYAAWRLTWPLQKWWKA